MRLDFYYDSRKKYTRRIRIPEHMHGLNEYVKDWHPRKTQVLQDALTILVIILMSRIFKKGLFRIWIELREFLGFKLTPFQEKLYYGLTEHTQFYHGKWDRADFVMMMCNHFDQHVLLYGFERYPCLNFQRFVKKWYVEPEKVRLRALKGYDRIKANSLYESTIYIRPDYS